MAHTPHAAVFAGRSPAQRDLLLVVSLFLLLAVVPQARATVIVPVPDDVLVEQSVAVVIGKVTAIESHRDPQQGQIFTHITLSLDEVLKGELSVRELTITQVGGTVGELHSWVYGSPEFTRGEKVLLFLRLTPDGTLRVAHLYQGKFSVLMDQITGEEFASRETPSEGVAIRGPKGAPPAKRELHRFKEFKERIRGILRNHPKATDQAQAGSTFIVSSPLASGDAEVQDQFTFLGTPSRWFEPDSNTPVVMRMNLLGAPAAPGSDLNQQIDQQILTAYQAWSTVSGSSFVYQDGGATLAQGFTNDGVSAISFGDPEDEMESPMGCSGTLALGGFSSTSSQTTIVNDQSFRRILWGDVVFNDGWDGCGIYEDPTAFAVAEIAAHELGHVLGLGHSQDDDATMAAFVHLDGRGASAATILMDDDKAGAVFVYPTTGPFTLTVTMAGAGTGSVTSNPGGIVCGNDCSEIYTRGTQVTLAAAADPSFTFVGWTGPADCADGVVTITADMTCTATFARGPDLTGLLGQLIKKIKAPIEKLKFLVTVRNVGDLTVPLTVNPVVHVYLSADAILDPSDTLVFEKQAKPKRLSPGGVELIKGKATVPTPSQGKFLILKVDATDVTIESGEANNLVILPIP